MLALTNAEMTIMAGGFNRGLIDGYTDSTGRVVRDARKLYKAYRARFGYGSWACVLTSPEAQPKLGKSARPAFGLMLVPARGLPKAYWPSSKPVNLCPRASAGCEVVCLFTAGHGAFDGTQRARAVRTGFLLADPYAFGAMVGAEIRAAQAKHGDISLRLNVVSDIRWELVAPGAMRLLIRHGVRLYDYTAWAPASRGTITGYHLTYSAKEPAHTPDDYLAGILSGGGTVAMPFAVKKGQPLPLVWLGFPVVDGDLSDDRTLDPSGVVVGLRQKGHKVDTSGFIRQLQVV
jgi:hypothetical protein